MIFFRTKSLQMLFSGVIGKGKSLALQARSLRPTWFHATPQDVIFRDLSSFVAGELSKHQSYWKFILSQHPKKDEILSYIVRGVNISDFFVPFKGDFQGKFYDSAIPPAAFFPNSKSCLDSDEFISSTILDRVKNGSLLVGEKLAQFSHLIWLCPLRWNQRNQECATMTTF